MIGRRVRRTGDVTDAAAGGHTACFLFGLAEGVGGGAGSMIGTSETPSLGIAAATACGAGSETPETGAAGRARAVVTTAMPATKLNPRTTIIAVARRCTEARFGAMR